MLPLLRVTLELFEGNLPEAFVKQSETVTAVQAIPAQTGALQVTFRHPRASHEIRLGHALIAYEFKRGQRRTIGFGVGPDGLEVRAPKWVSLRDVDVALRGKEQWILRKLQEAQQRQECMNSQVIDWRDGARLPYLGHSLIVVLDPTHGGAEGGAYFVPQDAASPELRISLPRHASAQQIRDRVQAWLMCQARQIFQQRLDHFAPQLGVQWKKLSLSNAGTRWGSARSDGSIRLNWRLVHFNLPVLDYVVVHELSHLRVMDHSPRFWDTVASVIPDHTVLRQRLQRAELPQWGA